MGFELVQLLRVKVGLKEVLEVTGYLLEVLEVEIEMMGIVVVLEVCQVEVSQKMRELGVLVDNVVGHQSIVEDFQHIHDWDDISIIVVDYIL